MNHPDEPVVTRTANSYEGRPARRWVNPYHARGLKSQTFNNLVRGPLTDAKIEKYRRLGYYSAEYRQARRELAEKKRQAQSTRKGAFLEVEGRLIYSPL